MLSHTESSGYSIQRLTCVNLKKIVLDPRHIRSWLRIVLCALLCIGATLDDIDYINAIRAPRTMSSGRASSVADDDTDDQHAHLMLAPAMQSVELGAPFLSVLSALQPPAPALVILATSSIRSGRSPPARIA